MRRDFHPNHIVSDSDVEANIAHNQKTVVAVKMRIKYRTKCMFVFGEFVEN